MEYEREETVVSPWTLPSEIHRILHDRPLLQVSAAQSSVLQCSYFFVRFENDDYFGHFEIVCLTFLSFLHCLYVFTYVRIYVCFV